MKKIIFIFLLFALNLSAEEAYLEPLDMIVEYYRSGYIDDNELREVQKLYDQVKKRKDTKYYMASKKHLSAIENEIIMQVNGLIDQEVGYDLEKMNETYKIYKTDGSLFPENELGKPRENHPAVKYDYPPVIKNYLESTKAKKKNEYYKNEINQILDELNYWLWYYSPMNPDAVLPETQNFMGRLSRSEVDAINYRVEVDGSLMYIFPDLATKGIDYLYENVKFMKKSSNGWALNTLLNTTIYVIEVNQIEDISVGMIKSVGFASYVKGAAFKVQVEFDKISKNLIERTQLAGGDFFGAKYKRGQMIPPDKSLIQQIAKNTIALYYIGDIAQYDEAADKIEKLFCMLVCKLQNIYKDFEFKWDEENSLFPNSILSPRNYTKPSFSVYNKIPKNTKANLSICEKTKNIEFPQSKQEPEQLEEKGTPEQPIGGGTPEQPGKPEQPQEKSKPGGKNAKNWWDDLHKFVKWEGSFKNDVLFLLINTEIVSSIKCSSNHIETFTKYDRKSKSEYAETNCGYYKDFNVDIKIPAIVNVFFDHKAIAVNENFDDDYRKVFLHSFTFDGKNFTLEAMKNKKMSANGEFIEQHFIEYKGSFSNDYSKFERLEITFTSMNQITQFKKIIEERKAILHNIPIVQIKYDKKKHFNIMPSWDLISNKNQVYYADISYYKYEEEFGNKSERYIETFGKMDNAVLYPPYLNLTAQHDDFIRVSGNNSNSLSKPSIDFYKSNFLGLLKRCPMSEEQGNPETTVIPNKPDKPNVLTYTHCDTLFFDDFNNRSKFSNGTFDATVMIDNSKLFVINGEWATKEGRLFGEADKSSEALVLSGDIEWRQYGFSGDFRFENDETGNFGIIFYAQKEKINSTRYILIHSLIKQNVELWEIDGNDKAQLLREDKYTFKKNTIYIFDLQLLNNEVNYKINGKNVLVWKETLELTKGRIGIRTAGKAKTSFDNLLVRKCDLKKTLENK